MIAFQSDVEVQTELVASAWGWSKSVREPLAEAA
ncbi:hypothetical protein ABH999_005800 [Bradyrhizobium yuanmingense]